MTLMLSTAELTALRADALNLLPGTAVIQRATSAVSDAGVVAQTWTAAGTVVCRVDPLKLSDPRRGMVAEREASTAYFQLTLAWNTDVVEGDRVVFAGETLEIMQLYDIHDQRIVKRATVARIEGA